MKRLLALAILLAVAAGCEWLPSDMTLCHDMCAPRAVARFVGGIPVQCACAVAQPDGGR